MKERPIIFSDSMVRAIIDGSKTQTRRVVKPQPSEHHWQGMSGYQLRMAGPTLMSDYRLGIKFAHSIPQNPHWDTDDWVLCPYGGMRGDRLWVREAWTDNDDKSAPMYRADMPVFIPAEQTEHGDDVHMRAEDYRWTPSIHMPRWASRILLEVAGVRVERVQDISDGDCIAEGIHPIGPEHDMRIPRREFRDLWDSINAARGFGWDANPWVWVIEFKRVRQ